MGSPAILRFFFQKPLFPIAMHTKTGMLFGQHFDGEPPRNLNHVILRQFENGFNKTIGMFMFKNQNDGATLLDLLTSSHSGFSIPEIACRLTNAVTSLDSWLTTRGLQMNIGKTTRLCLSCQGVSTFLLTQWGTFTTSSSVLKIAQEGAARRLGGTGWHPVQPVP